MPNWCYNRLVIGGDGKEVKKVLNFVQGKNGILDFNKIIPMPKEIEDSTKESTIDAITLQQKKQNKKPESKKGMPSWYEWSVQNWGTKWNCSEASLESTNPVTIRFDTAWSPPVPVIVALGAMFPKVSLHCHLSGTPDFFFPKQNLALFVDGCFWHGCSRCGQRAPKTRARWWQEKISGNKRRDRKANSSLKKMGIKVVRVWECQLKKPKQVERIVRNLKIILDF